jgi:hypothetical protein
LKYYQNGTVTRNVTYEALPALFYPFLSPTNGGNVEIAYKLKKIQVTYQDVGDVIEEITYNTSYINNIVALKLEAKYSELNNYITHFDFENLLYITTLVAGGVLVAAAGKKINLLSPLLCAVFVQSYFVTADNVILKNSEMDLSYVQPTLNALYHVEGLAEEYPDVYYYNAHQEKPWSTSAMQFVLSDFQVTEVPFEIGEDTRKAFLLDYFEENSIIVSSEDIALEQYSPHIYRLLYESINQEKEFMWVYGEEELAYILGNSETMKGNLAEWSVAVFAIKQRLNLSAVNIWNIGREPFRQKLSCYFACFLINPYHALL